MSTTFVYPKEGEIKVEWTAMHVGIAVLSTLLIWVAAYATGSFGKGAKIASVAGLNADIIGVVIASLKTPFYGHFSDGGKIELMRANVEKKYFQGGMWLVALGSLLQALGTLLS